MRLQLSSVIGFVSALTLGLSVEAAGSGPDLTVTMSQPSGTNVYQTARYTVTVANTGNQTSNAGSLSIQLPRTHTSPTVYVLGTVNGMGVGCTRSSTVITCPVARLRARTSAAFTVDLTLPQNAAPLELVATVTSSGEQSTTNNRATLVADLHNVDQAIATTADRSVTNDHCTGTGLTSYFECTLFPSSISSHDAVFHPDGTVSIPADGSYGGHWWQPLPNQLAFNYTDGSGAVVVDFVGASVGNGCFEGITHFPNSTSSYLSPYRVCIVPLP